LRYGKFTEGLIFPFSLSVRQPFFCTLRCAPSGSKPKFLSVGLNFRPIEVISALIFRGTKLASARGAAESTKKWLPDREGKGKNEPLSKFAISQPIKSGKNNSFWILVVEMATNLFIQLVFSIAPSLFRKAMSKHPPFLTKFKKPTL
jgi:hypothetical protein